MNAITRRNADGSVTVPAAVEPPPMPTPAARYLRDLNAFASAKAAWEAAHPDEREAMFVGQAPRVPNLIGNERAEVEVAARVMDRDLEPVSPALFRAWLGPVNAAVRNPQPEEDFAVRCMGLFELLRDLPGGAFTAEARRGLPAFFPSAADVRAAVEPGANRLRRMRQAMTAFERPPEPQQAPASRAAERTAEEVAAVRAKLAAFDAEKAAARIAAGQDDEKPKDKPRYIQGAQLIASYERQIELASEQARGPLEFRLNVLRRQMEGAR